ncbi:MAG: DUF4351 domain-containing protein [Magnetococcales bacterium]|nr:DUF4351 domain-containing protein [Magnetococcales bacterium]
MLSQYAQNLIDEGLQKGRQEEAIAFLLRMMQHRFGLLPKAVYHQVIEADIPLLEKWADRLLGAQSLNEVFAD